MRAGFGGRVLALAGVVALAGGAGPDWRSQARGDVTAIHDILQANHPGAVDQANRRFAQWLAAGEQEALRLADQAGTEGGYWRAVRFYANGFRDGHVALFPKHPVPYAWPGFLTATDARDRTTVTVSETPALPVGTVVTRCDNRPVTNWLDTRVLPFHANADIPHERQGASPWLFVGEGDDTPSSRPARCAVTRDGRAEEVALDWHALRTQDINETVRDARALVTPALGLRQVGGVWFVSIPSFNLWGDAVPRMRDLLSRLKAEAPALHQAPYVVIDVRGNGGGNSDWGHQVAASLWGEAAVSAVENSFDGSVEWRASAANAVLTREAAARSAAAGLADDARDRNAVAQGMEAALRAGRVFYPDPAPPHSAGLPAGTKSPFTNTVFFLTDDRCASACLDFADIVVRLPGVVHVGMPTSADALYIDNVLVKLPSGRVSLSYSLKVYRHRVRGNNVWYTPRVTWPGGPMTDAALASWIPTLHPN